MPTTAALVKWRRGSLMRACFSPLGLRPHVYASVSVVAAFHCDEELISLLQFCIADRLAQQESNIALTDDADLQKGFAARHDEDHPLRWCRWCVALALVQLFSRTVPTRLCLQHQSMYCPVRVHRSPLLYFEIPGRPTPRIRSHPGLRFRNLHFAAQTL